MDRIRLNKKAFVRQADLKRMATVALEFGVCVEVEHEGVFVRMMPSGKHRVTNRQLTREEKAELALSEWDAKRKSRQLPDDFAL